MDMWITTVLNGVHWEAFAIVVRFTAPLGFIGEMITRRWCRLRNAIHAGIAGSLYTTTMTFIATLEPGFKQEALLIWTLRTSVLALIVGWVWGFWQRRIIEVDLHSCLRTTESR